MSEGPWEKIDKLIESLSPEQRDLYLKIGKSFTLKVSNSVFDALKQIYSFIPEE